MANKHCNTFFDNTQVSTRTGNICLEHKINIKPLINAISHFHILLMAIMKIGNKHISHLFDRICAYIKYAKIMFVNKSKIFHGHRFISISYGFVLNRYIYIYFENILVMLKGIYATSHNTSLRNVETKGAFYNPT